jgi:SAM-dependent methyltransferase
MEMITANPKLFWNNKSAKPNWREYILPKRTNEEFEKEGTLEAKNISKFIDKNDVVLEYGCGNGRILKYITANRKIGLDICKSYIEKAKADKTSEYYLVDEFKGDADFIYSISVFQHNTNSERLKMLKNIKNLLTKRGRVLISFPHENSTNYKETEFVHKFTKSEIETYGKLFSDFEILEGNLVNYGDGRPCKYNEYFLLATK